MKPTKKSIRILKAVSRNLRPESYMVKSAVVLPGIELIESGQTEVEGITVDAEKEYIQEIPLYNEVNHFRRLKRAYISGGIDAVKRYLHPYVKEEYRDKLFSGLEGAL